MLNTNNTDLMSLNGFRALWMSNFPTELLLSLELSSCLICEADFFPADVFRYLVTATHTASPTGKTPRPHLKLTLIRSNSPLSSSPKCSTILSHVCSSSSAYHRKTKQGGPCAHVSDLD